jgi:acyl-coenzyme A thioesterase PaaI-like protein
VSVEESQGLGHGARLAGYFATESMRTGESAVSTWLQVRDDLRDAHGDVRIGPIVYSVDVATGLAMGVTVLADDRWVVTTDVDVRLITPVKNGPVRVDAEVLRAGATTAVSAFTLNDESTGRVVGGGTCTGRPFPFDFERTMLDVPIGVRRLHAPTGPVTAESLPEYLGFRVAEGGAVEVEIGGWLRNPWGILHGGVTACLVDVSAEAAGAAALGPAGARRRHDRALPGAGSHRSGPGDSASAHHRRWHGPDRGQGHRRRSRRSPAGRCLSRGQLSLRAEPHCRCKGSSAARPAADQLA